jgi:hypothetical protein
MDHTDKKTVVIPAEAGIQDQDKAKQYLDSHLHGNDRGV